MVSIMLSQGNILRKCLHFPPHERTLFYKSKNYSDGEKVTVIATEMDLDKQGKQKLTCKLGPFLNYGVQY